MQRYEQGGLAALAERSHRPQSCPHQIDARVEERIVTLRQGTPPGAPARLQHQLTREKLKDVLSTTTGYEPLAPMIGPLRRVPDMSPSFGASPKVNTLP
jgi:hypothetical protein